MLILFHELLFLLKIQKLLVSVSLIHMKYLPHLAVCLSIEHFFVFLFHFLGHASIKVTELFVQLLFQIFICRLSVFRFRHEGLIWKRVSKTHCLVVVDRLTAIRESGGYWRYAENFIIDRTFRCLPSGSTQALENRVLLRLACSVYQSIGPAGVSCI